MRLNGKDLTVREEAEHALFSPFRAVGVVGLAVRGTDRQRGGNQQQEGQQTSKGRFCKRAQAQGSGVRLQVTGNGTKANRAAQV